jgi:hypothetical protein
MGQATLAVWDPRSQRRIISSYPGERDDVDEKRKGEDEIIRGCQILFSLISTAFRKRR